jgi:amino acid adenylation domain-containing protein/non-ribosomal peptide synthase protein (TIGR01720 family)
MSDIARRIAELSPAKRDLLLKHLGERKDDGPLPVRPARREADALPLSFAQQRLWFLDQLEPGSSAYNIPMAMRLVGRLDVAALERSLNEVVRRHEVLRTTFAEGDGQAVQIIKPSLTLTLPAEDLTGLPESERESETKRLAAQEAQAPFSLTEGPLIRAKLLRLGRQGHVLLVTVHHIVFDGWSTGVLLKEVTALYAAYSRGLTPALPELPIQYADFALWQREWLQGAVLDRQLAYWRQQLSGPPPVLELPTDRARPAVQSHRGATTSLELTSDLSAALRRLSRREGATLFMTLLAAFDALLYRYTGQEDIVVGTDVANRNRAEIGPLVGFFVNQLALRVSLSNDPTFLELLGRAREAMLGAQSHQDLPFDRLVEALNPKRDMRIAPIFQVKLLVQHADGGPGANGSVLSVEPLPVESETATFDLTLSVTDAPQGLTIELKYNTDLFDAPTAARVLRHLEALLRAAVAEPGRRISRLPMLSESEQRQLLLDWNDTETEYPGDESLHELVEAQARRTPDATALVFGGARLTYRELNERANRLAHYLRSLGVGPESVVGVCMERSVEMVVSLLGTLKAGGAYLPLDPAYPKERLALMLGDSRPAALLCHEQTAGSLPEWGGRVVALAADCALVAGQDSADPPRVTSGDNAAYVIYTSGSTGVPKGAVNTHRGIRNRLLWMQQEYGLTGRDCVLQKTPYSFDVSVWEFFWPLMTGARLALAKPGGHGDARYLVEFIKEEEVSTLHFVPAMLRAFLSEEGVEECASLRRVICSGEELSPDLQERFYARSGAELHNLYGPTEAAVDVTYWACARDGGRKTVPIGRPISNTRIYVLDARMQLVPAGVAGELYIGGVGVARGYLNRPALTAERFVPDPFSGEPGARLYRTGDLTRHAAGGEIEYLGRLDHQVKVRGYRIELGEIEAALARHEGVGECVVVARTDAAGAARLVAYVVARTGASASTEQLRGHLKERLPDYMLPSFFMPLDALPLLPNGKVDRRSLPPPDRTRPEPDGVVEETGSPTQEMLAGIYSSLLGIERVGKDDDFFELGGHSLLATQLISRVRGAFQVELLLSSVFDAPTVAALADKIDELHRANQGVPFPPMLPAARDGELPLSFAQQRLWFLDQLEPNSPVYNLAVALRVTGNLDVAALGRSLDEVVRRHEVLRTTFKVVAGSPVQEIRAELPVELPLLKLGGSAEEREAEALRLAQEEGQRPFDLAEGPLLRAQLLHVGDADHVLLFTMHHIISDGWSMGVLVKEVTALYAAFSRGEEPSLPALPIQYADYAVWQRGWLRGEVLEAQLSYWRRQLEGAPASLELPTDRPRPAAQSYRGSTATLALSKELSESLKSLSRRGGVTLFMTLLAAFDVLLCRYTGQEDIVVGSDIANRNRGETEGLLGFFINQLVLRTDLSGDPTFRELLARVRQVSLEGYAHQDVPFEKLVEALQPERHLSRSPLFQTKLLLQNTPRAELRLPGLALSPLSVESKTSRIDLTLSMQEMGEQLTGLLEYSTELFDAATVERMLSHYVNLLEAAAASPGQRISELPVMAESERRQLLVEWNGEGDEAAPGACVHHLFERQVARTPDAAALSFAGRQLSYRELDARADRLARHLHGLGVRRGTLVGLCVERSPELVVGLLGVLKAGGAYLPLDPSYPLERLAFMIEDAQAPVLLTLSHLADALPPFWGQTLCLDEDREEVARESDRSLDVAVTPGDLAYVIYTSGSTGRPKGVLVEHRGVGQLAAAQAPAFGLRAGVRQLQFASPGFDASVSEIFTALLSGATLVLAGRDELLPGPELLGLLRRERIHTVTLPPTLLSALEADDLPELRVVVAAGESCGVEAVSRWLGGGARRFLNAYGPTEATVCATMGEVSAGGRVTIGRPLGHARVYVLNGLGEPVPVGVTGELYVGGGGVARGYLNRPGLTAERFVPDPFSGEPGARLYRTGDVVRWLPTGELEFVGRLDRQVKVRGFRIEPGEVEAALSAHAGVRACAVVAREDAPGERRLVAYCVLEEGGAPSRPSEGAHDQRLELWPSVAEFYVYDDLLYHAMTNDERRNESYRVAIRRAVPGKVVLDIGTGKDAILARLCAEAGAARVYAVELLEESYRKAKETVERLGLSERITVIHGDATQVVLPEPMDVCVSEIVGPIGGCEGAAQIINGSWRLLKPGGVMIPSRSVTKVAAVELPEEFLEDPGFTPVSARYVERVFEQVGHRFDLRLCMRNFSPAYVVSDAGVFEELDFTGRIEPEYEQRIELTVGRDAKLSGLVAWLNLTTVEGEVIDILEAEHCWLPVYLPVFDNPVEVREGDRVEGVVVGRLSDNGLNLDYTVRGVVRRRRGGDVEFEHTTYHHREVLGATALHRKVLADGAVSVSGGGRQQEVSKSLRAYLRERLPEYMVPSAFVTLDELPTTPSGKIDRRALPSPEQAQTGPDSGFAAPRDEAERVLAGIWAEVLRVERVGVRDNFFELGGDSILSIQIVTRAAQAGLRLTTKQLFQHQTVAELAAAAGRGGEAEAAEQGLVTGGAPLTPIQRWFFGQEPADPHHFNQSIIFSVRRSLDVPRLEQALGHLTAHHDSLRLRFRRDEEGWQQSFAGTVEAVEVRHLDVSALGEAERRSAVGRAADEVQRSLDLEHGPLIRVALFDGGDAGPSSLLLVVHHLAVDGVSWRILLEDLQTAYGQLEAGEVVRLPAKTTSYKRWAEALDEYARGPELEAEAAYWSRAAGERPAALPVDKSGGENTQASAANVSVSLGREQTQRLLKEVPAAYGTQINDVLLLALARACNEWTGESSLLVEMEGHGREEVAEGVDVSRTVGWFTSIYPVLLKLDGGGVGDQLKYVKERLRAVPQRGMGYGLLRYVGREETRRLMRALPDAELSFNYLGQLDQVLEEDGLLGAGGGDPSGEPFSRRGRRSHLLSINSLVAGGRLQVSWTYSENLHERATVERLAADYIAELERIINHCLTAEASGYTPSDFPLAGLGQEALDGVAAAYGRIEDIYPLAPMQQGMLFHSLYAPASGTYFEQLNCLLAGGLDVAAFKRAWQRVIERHAVLRTAFIWEGLDEPLQVVLKEAASPFKELDWSGLPPSEQQARLETLLASERAAGFELSRAPLMHLILIKLGAEAHEFIWSHHHALLDGWCVSILLREVFDFYRAFGAGEELRLEPAASYRNYIAWLKRQDLRRAERFWRETLKGFESPTRLTGSDAEEGGESFERGVEEVQLPAELSAQLQALARQNQLTLNTLMQGAWALLLSRYSGERDVLFGVTVSGRPAELPGVETMMGIFINALPMRVRLTGREQLIPWLKALQAWQVELREYEYTPLVQVQGWSEAPKGRRLFDSLFIFENYPVADAALRQGGGGELQPQAVGVHEQTNYPLTVVSASGPQMPLKISYDCRRFGREAVRRMLGHMQALLEGFVSRPGLAVSQLPMLTPGESRRLLAEWSGARTAYPGDLCVHHLFEQQAARAPDSTAVVFGDERLTYAELNARADRLAGHLRAMGVGPETLVGLCVERSPELVVGLLGILKAGGAYAPLDPAYPPQRLAFMLEDVGASVLLTQRRLLEKLPKVTGVRTLCLDAEWEAAAREGGGGARGEVLPENIAYVIYTSGSTGTPKGVLVPHRGLVNLAAAQRRVFGLRPENRVLQFSSLGFDASIFEIVMALANGAALYLAPQERLLPGPGLVELMREEGVTNVTLPPSVLAALPPSALPELQTLVAAGEACPAELVSRWGGGRRFFNAYGPTETTIWATTAECAGADEKPPIGRPIPNVQVYVLDVHQQPVAVGVTGELYIGGVGLSRGYHRRPALTAERFVPHPWGGEQGARLYRTGDLVRWREDGELEVLGRADEQVKVRGYRIELGEIEAVLARHEGVAECVVTAREDVPGEKRLVAYVVAGADAPSADELRTYLRARLPGYMVPSAFVTLGALPLTPSGKLDRRALPAPEREVARGRAAVPPRDGLELHLVQMWEEILNTSPVGVRDNFFELGGHSLLALRLVTQIKKHYGKELPLAVLFQRPTIEGLAAVLSEEASLPRQSPLVAVQPRGSGRPFFCVHPVGGNVLCYVELARHLGPGRPFYGLQYVPGQEADARVEALAARYLEAVREAQPRGPYLLGGWSFGGLVAFEMARQLREQGEEVAQLVLIDSGVPAAVGAVGNEADDAELLARFVTDLVGRFVQGRPAAPVGVSLDALRGLTPDEQLRAVAESPFAADLLPDYGGLEQLKRLFEVFKANSSAAAVYAPKPYGGAVTLLRAGEGPPAPDPQLGWGEFVAGAVELHEVPGNHYSILTEPNVRVLAERLGSCLAAACGAGEPEGGAAASAPAADHS